MGGKSKGVIFVVLYMSIFDDRHTAALDGLAKLAKEYEECNFGRVCSQFSKSDAVYSARGIMELPAFEVIAEGRRISLTEGVGPGLEEVQRQLKAYGFVSTVKTLMEVSLTLSDEGGNAVPLGWRRDTQTNKIVSVKDMGQASKAGIKAGWIIKAVDGAPVESDDDFETWMSLARRNNKDRRVNVRFEVTSQVKEGAAEKTTSDSPSIDFFNAQGDAQASGNFQNWKPNNKKQNDGPGRLTSNLFPGSEELNKVAEKIVENVEKFFTREEGGGEEDGKGGYWEERSKNLGKKKKK